MADSSRTGDISDGSDIEVDFNENEPDFDGYLERNQVHERDLGQNDDHEWLLQFLEDSDDEEFEGFQNTWEYNHFTPRSVRNYTDNGGATVLHPEEAQPKHYFDQLWGKDMWQHLVTETNRYARQEREKNPPPPFSPKWKPVSIPTMQAFLGLCMIMGILRLPARNNYWRQKKRLLATNFGSVMSRDRFNLIWRYLHLSNNEDPLPQQPDKLYKIRWFLNYLSDKFRTMYTCYGNVTIDESMVKFKGRLSFRQYLPSKPIKWGIKIWVLAESDTGYMMNFQVYTGKSEIQGKGLAHRVVTDLLQNIHHKNVRVFMDNFYSSVALFKELLMRGIMACGTVRVNRKGLPDKLLPKNIKLQKHEYRVAQKDELSACTWMDTKPVMVLSNYHTPTDTGTVNRRSGNAQQQQVTVPSMLSDYQQNMKGVDLCDQMIGYYMLDHRSKKWWRRLFFYFMMAAAHNSYVLAKDTNPEYVLEEWPTYQEFLEDLATGLIDEHVNNRDPPCNTDIQQGPRHDFLKLFEKEKVCVECRAKLGPGKRAGATRFGCRQCNVAVHTQCFPGHITRANNV